MLLVDLGGFWTESSVLVEKLTSFVSRNPMKQKQLSGRMFALVKPGPEVGMRIFPFQKIKASLSMCLKGKPTKLKIQN